MRAGAAICLLSLLSAGLLAPGSQAVTAAEPAVQPSIPEQPNIIVVMVDDLSYELMQYMPAVRDMLDEGTEFTNYFVSTSRCCPSRTTFLSGEYPHNTGVLTNTWGGGARGGIGAYVDEIGTDLGVVLQGAGYRTGFIGKYLNEYREQGEKQDPQDPQPKYPARFVPAGWSEWYANGAAYGNFNYDLVTAVDPTQATNPPYPPGFIGDQALLHGDYSEDAYLTTKSTELATDFIARAHEVSALPDPGQLDPFALVITPFATHAGSAPNEWQHINYPPAPSDRPRICPPGKSCPPLDPDWDVAEYDLGDCGAGGASPTGGGCGDVAFPDPRWAPTYDDLNDPANPVHKNPPEWLPDDPLDQTKLDKFEAMHLQRIQMAQGVSDLIDAVRQQLRDLAIARDTYLVFTSDNGYHLGQHRLTAGKGTAYDHDVRVPLVVVPPGDPAPRTVSAILQNTDLAPTLVSMADSAVGLPYADGADFFSLIRHEGQPALEPAPPAGWRKAALLTYVRDPGGTDGDPDVESGLKPPSFYALRTADYLYVDYRPNDADPPVSHLRGEFYLLSQDPDQVVNRYDELKATRPQKLADLFALLEAYSDCHEDQSQPTASCQAVAQTAPVINLPPLPPR